MGYEYQVETRRILSLIGLVIASIFIIQYFELPYRNTTMSFLLPNNNIASFPDSDGEEHTVLVNISLPMSALNEENKFEEQFLYKDTTNSNSTIADASRLVPSISPSSSVAFKKTDITQIVPLVSSSPPASPSANEDAISASHHKKTEYASQGDHTPPIPKEVSKKEVVSILEMMDMLRQSRVSSFSKVPQWPSIADQELYEARSQIEDAVTTTDHFTLYAPIYRNVSRFVRSYEIMEKKLKVFVYREGKRPVFHQPKLRGIYASEGWFMKLMESSQQYVTRNPDEAHLFYLPFSSQVLVDAIYVKNSHSFDDIREYLKNYLDLIERRYPFWNRMDGEDHFLVACHDWAPTDTRPRMTSCIRAMCNADVKEGFQFGKDVSLPETYVNSPKYPTRKFGSNPSDRKFLAFFAGQMHGNVRPILLQHWQNKDLDMKIFGRMRKADYAYHMKNSKYCICAKGYEVNSPRVVEAIVNECVPVILSDNFVPPFFEILQWESFAVFVFEKDIPNLKNILMSISERRYKLMQKKVKMVRQHFLWHTTPVKYDIFHMILHSVWYNRIFRLPPK